MPIKSGENTIPFAFIMLKLNNVNVIVFGVIIIASILCAFWNNNVTKAEENENLGQYFFKAKDKERPKIEKLNLKVAEITSKTQ